MTKVTEFLDKDPTTELREFLDEYRRTLVGQERVRLDDLLDELDMTADWYYSQNELNKGRLRHAEADLRLRHKRFWTGIEAVERIFSKIADAAREQRWAANARERQRELSQTTESRTVDRLRSVHTAAKGKGDVGAWAVWNTAADILGEPLEEEREAVSETPMSREALRDETQRLLDSLVSVYDKIQDKARP